MKLDASQIDQALLDSILTEIFDAGVEDPDIVYEAVRLLSDKAAFGEAAKRTHQPVRVRQFIEDPFYLNKKGTVWPRVMDELEEINNGEYLEVILTGGIGAAKTTAALYSQAYQLYLLSTLKNPHKEFELDPSSEIEIIFQSLNTALAKSVDYARFRDIIKGSVYFTRHFPFDTGLESEMRFPNRIIVKPVSGQAAAAIGQNVIGGVLDEANYGAVIEKSRLAPDGGAYDQVVENYNSLARRRENRFLRKGTMPGLVCIVSSAKYPGQFTDQRVAERDRQLAQTGNSTIYLYDKRVWEISPEGRFNTERFKVFVGSPTLKPVILPNDYDTVKFEASRVIDVPEEYHSQFESDIYNAVRDIAGMPTQAIHPFIGDAERVAGAFGMRESILSREDCDFVDTFVKIYPTKIERPKEPRFAHIDFGLTGDSAGVAIGYVEKFIEMQRGSWSETLPLIVFDAVLEVYPPKHGEIQFEKIRQLLYRLRELGMSLNWVSNDSFQSRDNMQILAQQGFITGLRSMDTDSLAYDVTKTLYDGRVKAPPHSKCPSGNKLSL
jgi:hypothetical protein